MPGGVRIASEAGDDGQLSPLDSPGSIGHKPSPVFVAALAATALVVPNVLLKDNLLGEQLSGDGRGPGFPRPKPRCVRRPRDSIKKQVRI